MFLIGQRKSPTSDIVFCSTEYIQKRREVSVFLFHCFQFNKTVVSSAPKVYGTIFLRIRGTRCLQLQERFSSFQSFLGFSLFYKEVEEGRCDKEESNTIDFFFLRNGIYMCVYMYVYVFSVLFCHDPNYLLSTKVCSNILS
ncbi:unnamed protein product [Rangifer tarandus platyrhynchus]|uniref:Uncharacterized protein n=1 Tax=Rangifer tarandus platyrhynchus TaxID=3082113 RepID=A0ABN8YI89_RANTA|nr:unnamed protein product [Rangifer tarandus platyrhynchus]